MGGEVKGKLADGVGSQYSSRYLVTRCFQHYYRWCAHLGCQQSTELTPSARFKWTGPFIIGKEVESSWNVMAHGDAREGKWTGKLAIGVGSQYSSHYLGTWCMQYYYRWCAHLGCQQSTELTPPPADLNGLVRFAEWRNLVSEHAPSHFDWPVPEGTFPLEYIGQVSKLANHLQVVPS